MSNVPPPPSDDGRTAEAGQQPQVVYVEKKKGGALKWVAIIGLVSLVALGGCTALLAAGASNVQDEFEKQAESDDSDEALVQKNAVITRCEASDFGTAEVDIEFTNPLNEEKGYIGIEVNMLDSDDVVIGSANVTFENIEAGQKARGTGTAFDVAEGADVSRCEVVDGTIL